MSEKTCPLCGFNGMPGGCEVCGTKKGTEEPSELQKLLNAKLETVEDRMAQVKAELGSQDQPSTAVSAPPRGLWTPDRAGQMVSPVNQLVSCVACGAPKAVSNGDLFTPWCPHCNPETT